MPNPTNVSLRIKDSNKELTLEQSKQFIQNLINEDVIRTYLVNNPECEYYMACSNNKCFRLPAGLCVYSKFVKKERECARCTSPNIVKEINNLLDKSGQGNYQAFWKAKQVRRRRKKE